MILETTYGVHFVENRDIINRGYKLHYKPQNQKVQKKEGDHAHITITHQGEMIHQLEDNQLWKKDHKPHAHYLVQVSFQFF